MLIFDAHLDLGLNGVDWNRNLDQDVADLRAQEKSLGMTEPGRGGATLSFPELRKAEVGVCVATVLARLEQPINHSFGWTSPEACFAIASSHLAYYRALERRGSMRMLRTQSDLARHVAQWNADAETTPFGYILSMECADAVLDPDHIHDWHEQGLRAIGITHYGPNRYGGGTRSEAGLAAEALPLLANIEKLGMLLDLTHLSDRAFWQVAEKFGGRVLASHQAARKFCDWQRQFSDPMIKFTVERGGVFGMPCDLVMLQPGYVRGESPRKETLERLADNIDHICQLAGNAKHVGIGSDLDGGYGVEQTPADLDTIADLQKLAGILANRGYSATDVAGVMHGNFLRLFGEALPA
ncbi:MAG TPA: membrane dipeptidase [Planctomycetia bacterium]|nr:membrane dipeptidase [Planctomycetia bacterium]